jgi:hypothetical protein
MIRYQAALVCVVLALSAGAAPAKQSETQMGAWRYVVSDDPGTPAFRMVTTNATKNASFGFQCDKPDQVSIYAFIVPGEKLGLPRNGAFKKSLTYQVDSAASVTKDWFYPDESKGEEMISKIPGVDSFDVVNAVRKGKKSVRVQAGRADGKTLELQFDIAGADAAVARLIADCKSAEYR